MTVIAPTQVSYLNRVPYLTIAEFKYVPTGLDLSNLVEDGTPVAQDNALQELINRASARADVYCFGAAGTLCATENTQNDRVRADRFGWYHLRTNFWPIVAVTSFQVGSLPGDMVSIPLSVENCFIEDNEITVTEAGFESVTAAGPIQFGGPRSGRVQFAQFTYINGWPNTFLSASCAAGDDSIDVLSAVGLFPGTTLTIFDPPDDEPIVVDTSYVPGSLTVPLATPLQYAHVQGTNVSALPNVVKQAVIHLVSSMVKSRGSGGFTISQIGGVEAESAPEAHAAEDEGRALGLLDDFRCVI